MATQEATPGSQSEESSALDLPTVYDIRDYVLQRPHQEADSEAFSSVEALSSPCSSDADPGQSSHRPAQIQGVKESIPPLMQEWYMHTRRGRG
ncbi:shieldin complex subunit 1 isoform X2 [Panthera leo]|uniref:shieldin complex subunit 1 isoform X2 n=1 Tax=Panthera leo TaxID=9689 RepID=UPI001C6A1BB1|nr:shieldin complex subunit 1 isoform X2 [Panthera leo]